MKSKIIIICACSFSLELFSESDKDCSYALQKAKAAASRVHGVLEKIVYPRVVKVEEFLEEDFFHSKSTKTVVAIDGIEKSLIQKPNREILKLISGESFADEQNVFYRHVAHPDEMIDKLVRIYEKNGPINNLLIMGHGSPGFIGLGSTHLSLFWYLKSRDLLESLPKDLFAQEARVILVSCSCGGGFLFYPNFGVHVLEKIFSKILKQGGQILAPVVPVTGDIESWSGDQVRKAYELHRSYLNQERVSKKFEKILDLGLRIFSKPITFILSDPRMHFSKKLREIKISSEH